MTQLQNLSRLAKQSFDVAVATGAYRPEGVVIVMKSGLVLTGHSQTQPIIRDAARDALRSIIPTYPTESKVKPAILDQFTIASVIVISSRKNTMPSRAMMDTLQDYPSIVEGARIYAASPKTDGINAPQIVHVLELRNSL